MRKIFLTLSFLLIGQVSFSQPVPTGDPQKIKLLSWNIYMLPGLLGHRNKLRAEAIGKQLAESDYDILVFQEAFGPAARKKIRKLVGKQFPWQAGPANRKLLSLKTNSGLWIFSRFPITSSESITFHARTGVDALSRKGALLINVDIHGQPLQVIATHLQNCGSIRYRHAQCDELFARLLEPHTREGVPQIVCGDFNINRTGPADQYQKMLTALGADDGDLKGTRKYSFDHSANDMILLKRQAGNLIDYVLVRENGAWISIDREISAIRRKWHPRHQDLSDHFAMQAEVTFSAAPPIFSLR